MLIWQKNFQTIISVSVAFQIKMIAPKLQPLISQKFQRNNICFRRVSNFNCKMIAPKLQPLISQIPALIWQKFQRIISVSVAFQFQNDCAKIATIDLTEFPNNYFRFRRVSNQNDCAKITTIDLTDSSIDLTEVPTNDFRFRCVSNQNDCAKITHIIIFKDRLWWMISALNGTRASFLPQFESDRRALLYWNKLTCRNKSNKSANRNNRIRLWLECFFDIWYQYQCLFVTKLQSIVLHIIFWVLFWLPGDLISNIYNKEAYRKLQKASRKPQGSFKNFQGRNPYNIFVSFLVETVILKNILKLTDLYEF